MKKNLRTLASIMLALSMVFAVGCNKDETPATSVEQDPDDYFDMEVADAYAEFIAAQEATSNIESKTVRNEIVVTSTGDDGKESTTTSITDLKLGVAETGEVCQINMKSIGGGVESEMNFYYEDEWIYFEQEQQKLKEAITFDELLSVVGSYEVGLAEEVVESAQSAVSDDGIKHIKLVFNKDKLTENVTANIGTMTDSGEKMNVNSASLVADIDDEGRLLGFDYCTDAVLVEGESEDGAAFIYDNYVDFSEFGTTTPEAPETLEGYTDVATLESEEETAVEGEEASEGATEIVAQVDGGNGGAEFEIDTNNLEQGSEIITTEDGARYMVELVTEKQ